VKEPHLDLSNPYESSQWSSAAERGALRQQGEEAGAMGRSGLQPGKEYEREWCVNSTCICVYVCRASHSLYKHLGPEATVLYS
jgi:hypothetical protein